MPVLPVKVIVVPLPLHTVEDVGTAVPTVGGETTVTASEVLPLVPQEFWALTVTLPEVAVPQLTVIDVPVFAAMDAPLGTLQL